jgi:glycolate oxidase FAD binding subunit
VGLAAYAVNGIAPTRHVAPATPEAVSAAVADADAKGQAVVPFAGRTRLEVGNPPARYDLALDLGSLAGIVEHEPGDLTATVLAGTTLADLARRLGTHGQMWPVEAARPERATLGGVLAGAAPGPSRLRYGHPRDWTIGASVVLGDGSVVKAGGKVVKNVTGYDLTRLYAGSYGSLGVLVSANLKLWPLPDVERSIVARFDDVADAWDALAGLRRDAVDLDAAVSLDRPASAYVGEDAALAIVRLRGSRAAVARRSDVVARALAAGRPEEAREGLLAEAVDVAMRAAVALRLAVPERHMRETLAGASGVLRFDGAGTTVLVRETADASWVRQWRSRAEASEGSAILERAPSLLRAHVDTWGQPVVAHALAARIKAALDPRGTLSPGRMAGRL